jgi:hypothetical protein
MAKKALNKIKIDINVPLGRGEDKCKIRAILIDVWQAVSQLAIIGSPIRCAQLAQVLVGPGMPGVGRHCK